MDYNKIKNFNQLVLAAIGILSFVLLLIAIIWSATEFYKTISYRSQNENSEILSNENADKNYQNNVRTHQVSFENLQLVDSVNIVYLIPVSQTALELKEYINKRDGSPSGTLGLLGSSGCFSDFYYDYRSFNNVLIYDLRDESIHKLFNTRVSINRYYVEKIAGKSYVLFAVTDKDSNKDGFLNEDDSKSLFIYSTADKTFNEIKNENADFTGYNVIAGKDQILINYGLDKNGNGKYNWDEPMTIKVYSIHDNKLRDLVSLDLVNNLQNILDGEKGD